MFKHLKPYVHLQTRSMSHTRPPCDVCVTSYRVKHVVVVESSSNPNPHGLKQITFERLIAHTFQRYKTSSTRPCARHDTSQSSPSHLSNVWRAVKHFYILVFRCTTALPTIAHDFKACLGLCWLRTHTVICFSTMSHVAVTKFQIKYVLFRIYHTQRFISGVRENNFCYSARTDILSIPDVISQLVRVATYPWNVCATSVPEMVTTLRYCKWNPLTRSKSMLICKTMCCVGVTASWPIPGVIYASVRTRTTPATVSDISWKKVTSLSRFYILAFRVPTNRPTMWHVRDCVQGVRLGRGHTLVCFRRASDAGRKSF